MDTLLTQAYADLETVQTELAKLASRKAELEQRLTKLQMLIRVSEDLGYGLKVQKGTKPPNETKYMTPISISAAVRPDTTRKPEKIRIFHGSLDPHRATTQKAQITEHCAAILAVGFPMKTQELLEYLEKAGVEVGGTDKLQTISAALSSDDRFVPNRKEGWTVKS